MVERRNQKERGRFAVDTRGWGWSVMEDVSKKKGQTKGLRREPSLTVYYYRKLNQEAINAVYTILPLITPPLLHWPLCWLHPLRGGDSSSAITSELSCLLLITMLLLLMAIITVSVFYMSGSLYTSSDMKLNYGPLAELLLLLLLGIKCKGK